MANLIKMDLYRMLHSKVFMINLIIVTLISIASSPLMKALTNLAIQLAEKTQAESGEAASEITAYPASFTLSSLLISPFVLGLLVILTLISVVSFSYSDISGGFIKNYAGQLGKRSDSIISKFWVILIHNGIFMVCAFAGNVIGTAMTAKITIDDGILNGIETFLLKLLLLQSLATVLLLLTAGLRQKTLASIAGVVFGSGLMSLAYFGIESTIEKIFNIHEFNISDYAPDQLLGRSENLNAMNALIVSAAVIGLFLTITIKTFNKNDIK